MAARTCGSLGGYRGSVRGLAQVRGERTVDKWITTVEGGYAAQDGAAGCPPAVHSGSFVSGGQDPGNLDTCPHIHRPYYGDYLFLSN